MAVSPVVEATLLRILTEPIAGGHRESADARERILTDYFRTLQALDVLHLQRRLKIDSSKDELVVAFRRLVVERRERLRDVLEHRRKMLATLKPKP